MTQTVLERDGAELVGEGLYVDLPGWGCHVLGVPLALRAGSGSVCGQPILHQGHENTKHRCGAHEQRRHVFCRLSLT